ncbi:Uncharacterized protein APZ42_005726 [Daphnia magna]|uniref:Uncharacterized protein n=1 Tax=Daphnia magna TaxID=35525 RepID=A0A164GAH3_9CRUS|nr:Uncharacterized protein APZ42_005726 [Daphnia magna]
MEPCGGNQNQSHLSREPELFNGHCHLSMSDGCTRCSSQCTLARSEKGHVTSCTPPGCQKMEVTLEHFFYFLRRLEEEADERKKGSYH